MVKSIPSDRRSVTVVIAAKDSQDTIARAVSSSLAQPDAHQVIVVDDGSTDDTSDTARSVDDGTGRLEILRQDINRGPAAARNIALNHAKCTWYTMVDSDDFMDDGRLSKLIDLAGDQYDFVADDLWLVPEEEPGAAREEMWGVDTDSGRQALTFESFLEGNYAKKGFGRRELGFLKPIIRRARIEHLNLRYNEKMRLAEDLIFYAELLLDECMALLVAPQGYVAMRRADSLSARHGTTELKQFYDAIIDMQRRPGLTTSQMVALAKMRNSIARRYRLSKALDAKNACRPIDFLSSFATSPDVMASMAGTMFASRMKKMKLKLLNKKMPQGY